MGNVNMEASQINYRGGQKKMSVEEALKNTSGEAAAIAQLQTDVLNLKSGLTNKVGCTLIATTEATGTNKSKLNSLFAAYNALSQIDKFNAFIAYGNTRLLLAGGYAFASIQCAFSNDPSVIYSAILDASDSKFALVTFSPSGGYSVTDQSNVTDANQFYLYTLN